MTTRGRNLLVLAAVVLLAGAGVFLLRPKLHVPAATDAIPDGAFLVMTLDLERLRTSPLARDIGALRDVSDVAETCGFEPLAHVTRAAVGVPEKPDGVFGVALVTHDLAEEDLVSCAQRIMSRRSATAHVVRRGSWTEVEQQGVIAEATKAKIAYREGAPLLVARGDYLGAMQAALDGDRPRALSSPEHARLRKTALGDAFFVATAVLPQSVRDRIRAEVQADGTNKAMPAVLAVSAAALSVAAHGDELEFSADLECETDAACSDVRALIERKTQSLPLALHVEASGPHVHATLKAPETEVARAIASWYAGGQP